MMAGGGSSGNGRGGSGNGPGGSGSGRGGPSSGRPRPASGRPGRRALFSEPSGRTEVAPGPRDVPKGRRALFSEPEPAAGTPSGSVVVHCRTCLAATPMSLPAVGLALIPSLWLPTRPWPRLMRCPACERASWCRIDWPGPF